MSDEELKEMERLTKQRLGNVLGMNEEQQKFVINMVASFHSTRGAALYNINDYLDKCELWGH